MVQLGPRLRDFHEILYSSVFQKSVEKIQVSLKSLKNNGYILNDQRPCIEELDVVANTHISTEV